MVGTPTDLPGASQIPPFPPANRRHKNHLQFSAFCCVATLRSGGLELARSPRGHETVQEELVGERVTRRAPGGGRKIELEFFAGVVLRLRRRESCVGPSRRNPIP